MFVFFEILLVTTLLECFVDVSYCREKLVMLIHVCLFPKTVTHGLERSAYMYNVTLLKAKAIVWLIKVLSRSRQPGQVCWL